MLGQRHLGVVWEQPIHTPIGRYQERIMTSFLFGREEEERVTSYSGRGKAESFACTINSTSGRVVASVQAKRE